MFAQADACQSNMLQVNALLQDVRATAILLPNATAEMESMEICCISTTQIVKNLSKLQKLLPKRLNKPKSLIDTPENYFLYCYKFKQ